MRACIAVSLVVGFCFLLFVFKKKVLEYGIVGLILVLLEQQAFQLFFPSIYGCSCDVQSFIHSFIIIHPSVHPIFVPLYLLFKNADYPINAHLYMCSWRQN